MYSHRSEHVHTKQMHAEQGLSYLFGSLQSMPCPSPDQNGIRWRQRVAELPLITQSTQQPSLLDLALAFKVLTLN